MRFEDMFVEIGKRNDVKTFNFVSYVPLEEYDRLTIYSMGGEKARILLEETIKERIEMPAEHFRYGSLAYPQDEMGVDAFSRTLGVSSVVTKKRAPGIFHMKQLDFSCNPDIKNAESIADEFFKMKAGGGWLVDSGRSFHFYGKDVLNEREWIRFMQEFYDMPTTVMIGLLDIDYPLMNLTRGYSILRLSESELKKKRPEIRFEIKE